MSRAMVCDHCEAVLPLNGRGEHDGGEDSAWIGLSITNERFEFCTRSCVVVAFLDRPEVIEAHEAWTESITGIARIISGDADDDEADR